MYLGVGIPTPKKLVEGSNNLGNFDIYNAMGFSCVNIWVVISLFILI